MVGWYARRKRPISLDRVLNLNFPRSRLITLNGMKASEEITEEQSRQVHLQFPQWYLRLISFPSYEAFI